MSGLLTGHNRATGFEEKERIRGSERRFRRRLLWTRHLRKPVLVVAIAELVPVVHQDILRESRDQKSDSRGQRVEGREKKDGRVRAREGQTQ